MMVMSDDPALQSAVLSDATLTPKIEQCIAPVRANKQASIVLLFEVTNGKATERMAQAKPPGPHTACVSSAFSSRPLSASKKKASLQVIVTWS